MHQGRDFQEAVVYVLEDYSSIVLYCNTWSTVDPLQSVQYTWHGGANLGLQLGTRYGDLEWMKRATDGVNTTSPWHTAKDHATWIMLPVRSAIRHVYNTRLEIRLLSGSVWCVDVERVRYLLE